MAALLIALLTCAAAGIPIYLGVVEPPLKDDPSGLGRFRLRPVFRFADGHWSALPSEAPELPAGIDWTVAWDGKKMGTVQNAPRIRVGAADFQTWMGTSLFRPLVAISQPNFSDPDGWKPFAPPATLGRQAHAAFREAIALDSGCDGKPTHDYPEAYILLRPKAYRSARGDVLLALRADPARNQCGTEDGEWHSVWFLLRDGTLHWIGNGLVLLDAGDYDGSGRSKVIFFGSGYNRDGYILLDPRDGSKVESWWSYH